MILPFRFLKQLMPEGLLGRTLIIIAAPILLIQAGSSYFFIDRHLSKVTDTLARQSAQKIGIAADLLSAGADNPADFLFLKSYIHRHLDLTVDRLGENQRITPPPKGAIFPKTYAYGFIKRNLKTHLQSHPFYMWQQGEDFIVRIKIPPYTYIFWEKEKNIFPRTTPILMWWGALSSIVFMAIAVLFMRNQVRPLRKLVHEVEKFGKGGEQRRFRPSGSFEVRQLTRAFSDMRERINRFIRGRADMLAGVSHDLRTPITRLELQLAMMTDNPATAGMKKDLREMTEMIDSYLAFAKGDGEESTQIFDINELIADLLAHYDQSRLIIENKGGPTFLEGRPQFLKRAFQNLLDNSFKYAQNTNIRIHTAGKKWIIDIDDDGPGIPKSERGNVFRPFYRLEKSRNIATGGVGLGLSIAREAILGSGGTLTLGSSLAGGLNVRVTLPR